MPFYTNPLVIVVGLTSIYAIFKAILSILRQRHKVGVLTKSGKGKRVLYTGEQARELGSIDLAFACLCLLLALSDALISAAIWFPLYLLVSWLRHVVSMRVIDSY